MKTTAFFLVIVLLAGCQSTSQKQEKQMYNAIDAVNETMHYVPLSPCEIRPEGWLNDWAQKAASGITGQLDQRATTFEKGWSGESFEARGAMEEGTNWPLEQCAYWLDGLVRLAYILDDSSLIQKAKSRLDPVVKGVLRGGPSFIYWRSRKQLDRGFDNWAHSHMGRALVAYYLATGDESVLDALVQVYQHYPLPPMSPDFYPVSGAVNVDPMLDTYLFSGDSTVLNHLLEYAKTEGIIHTVNRWDQNQFIEGHSVIYHENIRVPAILYTLTHEKKYLDATEAALSWGYINHGLPIGLISGEEFSAGIGPIRNVETCNVAAGPWTINWLMKITGKGEYGDLLEKIFFNAGPAPIDKDFDSICYYQSPNRLSTEFPEEEPANPGKGSYRFTEIGHEVLCCVGNSNRIIPNFIMHMWMKPVKNDGIAATLYGPSTVKTRINDVIVKIKSQTHYPFREEINMTIEPEQKVEFKLSLRIPGWCKTPSVRVNHEEMEILADRNGFLDIRRTWEKGDMVEIRFPMHLQLINGKTTDYPEIPYYKEKENARSIAKKSGRNYPYVSIQKGPLLFALPIPDDGPNQVKKNVPFHYALDLKIDNLDDQVEIHRQSMPANWEWSLGQIPVSMTVPAIAFAWQPDESNPLPHSPVKDGQPVHIVLVPYGLTKFRVSMFPVSVNTTGSTIR